MAKDIVMNGSYKGISLEDVFKAVYPVGSIYTTFDSANPSTLFGGTWAALKGRVLVGIDTAQTEFNAIKKAGGAKTHTLALDEMPRHDHWFETVFSANGQDPPQGSDKGPVFLYRYVANATATFNNIVQPNGNSNEHNNLQPYTTCYMWERTA